MVHVAAGGAFSVRSVHLDATTKPRTERYLPLSDIHDFVQHVARYDSKNLPKNDRTLCQTKGPEYPFGAFSSEDITDDNAIRTAQICLKLLQFDEHTAMLQCGSDLVNAS